MSTDSASGRPAELDDPDWLRRRSQRDGDMAIAIELHVDRKTVRRARERLGIPSALPGRRRIPNAPAPEPTERQLAAEFLAAQHARLTGDDHAYDTALLAIRDLAGRLHDHRQKQRAA